MKILFDKDYLIAFGFLFYFVPENDTLPRPINLHKNYLIFTPIRIEKPRKKKVFDKTGDALIGCSENVISQNIDSKFQTILTRVVSTLYHYNVCLICSSQSFRNFPLCKGQALDINLHHDQRALDRGSCLLPWKCRRLFWYMLVDIYFAALQGSFGCIFSDRNYKLTQIESDYVLSMRISYVASIAAATQGKRRGIQHFDIIGR